ncbi:MAG: hypothetical protein WDZ81_01025 [Candidatus Saccharimonadales bacterium]
MPIRNFNLNPNPQKGFEEAGFSAFLQDLRDGYEDRTPEEQLNDLKFLEGKEITLPRPERYRVIHIDTEANGAILEDSDGNLESVPLSEVIYLAKFDDAEQDIN